VRGIAGHQLQQEIAAAADHVTLAHLGPGGDELFEGGEHGLALALQANDGEEGDLPAEAVRIGIGMVATDDAGLLQPADAAQARGRGNPGTAGQLVMRPSDWSSDRMRRSMASSTGGVSPGGLFIACCTVRFPRNCYCDISGVGQCAQ
jgi:hypothetical protein